MKLRNTHLTTVGKETNKLSASIWQKIAERIRASHRKTKFEIFCRKATLRSAKFNNLLVILAASKIC